jgi:hypothetical protein
MEAIIGEKRENESEKRTGKRKVEQSNREMREDEKRKANENETVNEDSEAETRKNKRKQKNSRLTKGKQNEAAQRKEERINRNQRKIK